MKIIDSEERNQLTALFNSAYDVAMFGSWQGYGAEDKHPNDILAAVGKIRGITLIEPGDFDTHNDYHCAHYVFGVVMGEPWAKPHETVLDENHALNLDPIEFLAAHGYLAIEIPAAGDVVVYAAHWKDTELGIEEFRHFGVMGENYKVISKLTHGPVIEHPIDLIPEAFGSLVYFYRKQP